MQLSKEGGTSWSAAKGVVCGSATPFVPQGVPPNLFKLFLRGDWLPAFAASVRAATIGPAPNGTRTGS